MNRRAFFGLGAAAAASTVIAGSGLAGCAPQAKTSESAAAKTPSWETDPTPITSISATEETDVVVIGGGMAGCSAACSAAEQGVKVIQLEKTKRTQFRGIDYGALASKYQVAQGIDLRERKQDLMQEILRWGGNRGDYRVIQAWADKSSDALDWAAHMLETHGIDLAPMPREKQEIPHAWYYHYPTDAFQIVPNDALMAEGAAAGYEPPFAIGWSKAFTAYADELGVDMRFDTEALQLISDKKGVVSGVIVKSKEAGTIQIKAKSVVLATGGYGFDEEMMDAFIPGWREDIYNISTPPHNTGDGIRMGAWAGGAIDPAPHCPMYFDEGVEGLSDQPSIPLTRQPWLYLNDHGERFMNEDAPYAYVCRAHNSQPRHKKWVFWDSKWEIDGPKMGMVVCKDFRSPLHNLEALKQWIDEGKILSGNTLDELLAKMEGIDVEEAKKSIARYNELCAAGKDTDFFKREECLSSLTEPPFYGVHTGTTLLVTMGGLQINERQQVLDNTEEKNPITGLWAAGNCSGSFFFDDYPITVSGVSHGRACTGGRSAGQNAATFARNK